MTRLLPWSVLFGGLLLGFMLCSVSPGSSIYLPWDRGSYFLAAALVFAGGLVYDECAAEDRGSEGLVGRLVNRTAGRWSC